MAITDIINVKCDGQTVDRIVDEGGNTLKTLTAEVENAEQYVKPVSVNEGGALASGTVIPAGTYFAAEASVPAGGGAGWAPRVASGIAVGSGLTTQTITHNMGTENIILFLFSPVGYNGGTAPGGMSPLLGVIVNPKAYINPGHPVTVDASAYNNTAGNGGVIPIDWGNFCGGMCVDAKTPYANNANLYPAVKLSDTVFEENRCIVNNGWHFTSGAKFYWYAFEVPAYSAAQKITAGEVQS